MPGGSYKDNGDRVTFVRRSNGENSPSDLGQNERGYHFMTRRKFIRQLTSRRYNA